MNRILINLCRPHFGRTVSSYGPIGDVMAGLYEKFGIAEDEEVSTRVRLAQLAVETCAISLSDLGESLLGERE